MKITDKVIRKALEIGEEKRLMKKAKRMLDDEYEVVEAPPAFARWFNTWIK